MAATNSNAAPDVWGTKINNADESFRFLTGKAGDQVSLMGVEIRYGRGARIFGEGEASQHIFILRTGRVKLSIASPNGKTLVLRLAEGGEVLGLAAALNKSRYEATAETLEPCSVMAIRANDFLNFLATDPEAAMEVTYCMLREYQIALNGVCRLALPATVAGRLATLLLGWLRWCPSTGKRNAFTMTLTHDEIAGMTGTSRETVSRVFHQLRQERIISIQGSSFTVLRPEALEELAM